MGSVSDGSARGIRAESGRLRSIYRATGAGLRWSLRVAWWTPAALLCWAGRPYEADLLVHFCPHAAVATIGLGAVILAGCSLWRRLKRWRRLGVEGVFAGGAALVIAMVVAGQGPAAGALQEATTRVRIVVFNARGEATRADEEFDGWLRGRDADIVCILDPPWRYERSRPWILEEFPHVVAPAPGLRWAIVVLSKHPLEPTPLVGRGEAHTFSFAAHRSVVVALKGGARLVFTATHPPSPRTRELWREGIESAALDGGVARAIGEATGLPVVMAGDFNSTPVGRLHRAFAKSSGLRTWPALFGRGTWPAWAWPGASLPIDRVWSSPEAPIRRVEVGPRFRSDHRPVVVEVEVAAGADQSTGGGIGRGSSSGGEGSESAP